MTGKDRIQLKAAFERTPTLFQILSTVRSRRMAEGYVQEAGVPETHPLSGRPMELPKGPLAYSPSSKTSPLSELETALLCWAACGPNGVVSGDIGLNTNLSTMLCFAGRTIPGPCNDAAVDLIFTNDRGTFLYKPTLERTKAVEIEGEEDYGKVLKWFRDGCVKLSDSRPDLDWAIMPGRLMGIWQYNLNRPGTTWFMPVVDVAKEMVNVFLTAFENLGWLIIDDETGEPAGLKEWARPGYLEVPVPLSTYEETVFSFDHYAHGMLIANLRLAGEALGLGSWIFGGFSEDLVLGGLPSVAKGLGFSFETIRGKNNYIGIPGVLEGYGLPAPWNKSPEALVDKVAGERYSPGSFFACEDNYLQRANAPFKGAVLEDILSHPKLKIPQWCLDATKSIMRYLYEKYGRFPVNFSTFHSNFHAIVHHVAVDYYKKFNVAGYVTERITDHKKFWHE